MRLWKSFAAAWMISKLIGGWGGCLCDRLAVLAIGKILIFIRWEKFSVFRRYFIVSPVDFQCIHFLQSEQSNGLVFLDFSPRFLVLGRWGKSGLVFKMFLRSAGYSVDILLLTAALRRWQSVFVNPAAGEPFGVVTTQLFCSNTFFEFSFFAIVGAGGAKNVNFGNQFITTSSMFIAIFYLKPPVRLTIQCSHNLTCRSAFHLDAKQVTHQVVKGPKKPLIWLIYNCCTSLVAHLWMPKGVQLCWMLRLLWSYLRQHCRVQLF